MHGDDRAGRKRYSGVAPRCQNQAQLCYTPIANSKTITVTVTVTTTVSATATLTSTTSDATPITADANYTACISSTGTGSYAVRR